MMPGRFATILRLLTVLDLNAPRRLHVFKYSQSFGIGNSPTHHHFTPYPVFKVKVRFQDKHAGPLLRHDFGQSGAAQSSTE